MKRLTVFTPTYNRAHTLPRVYSSLRNQDCKDFIWLIIDDGSTDNTVELVKSWQENEKEFEIRYIYKSNGGMHTAHNTAYENIDTELNTCIDSDDELAEGAIRKIIEIWSQIDSTRYAGIVGLDSDMKTSVIIGTRFPEDMRETTLQHFYSAGGKGDKKLVYRTDIMKLLPPYPVFDGEKYVSLGWKYLLCDQKYQLLTTNSVLCNVEYQEDGSSQNMFRQYLNNPQGFAFIRKENMKYNISWKRNVMDAIHYCSSSQICHNRNYLKESPRPLLTFICTPIGYILTAIIRRKVKQ